MMTSAQARSDIEAGMTGGNYASIRYLVAQFGLTAACSARSRWRLM